MGSFSTLADRADSNLRLSVAYAFIGILFVLNIITVSYPLNEVLKAPLVLMAIYYWAIYRPTLIPAWFVFLLGGLMDLLTGLPVGLNALIFVLTQWLVTDQRRFLMGQPFVMIWIGFTLLNAVVVLMHWGLSGLVYLQWLSLQSFWVPVFLGAVLFPIICVMLHLTHKILPVPGRALGPAVGNSLRP